MELKFVSKSGDITEIISINSVSRLKQCIYRLSLQYCDELPFTCYLHISTEENIELGLVQTIFNTDYMKIWESMCNAANLIDMIYQCGGTSISFEMK